MTNQPARVLLGDLVTFDISIDNAATFEDCIYILKLQGSCYDHNSHTPLLEKEFRAIDQLTGEAQKVVHFAAGYFMLLRYRTRTSNKPAGFYRGPMIITATATIPTSQI